MKCHFISSGRSIRLGWVVGFAMALPISAAGRDAPATRSEGNTAINIALDDMDKLFPAPGLTSEQEAERRKLEDTLDAARDPLDRATAHVALANWLLAVPTARPATRWVLGVENAADRNALVESATTAGEQLAAARTLLKAVSDSAAENIKKRQRRLVGDIENLDAFANVFAAAGETGDEVARKDRWASAAIELAGARESENTQVAAAATLWQAMAWEKAGRRERALMTLPEALAKPDRAHAFMGRILRCRILADGGQNAAAMALTTQIRARLEDWFPRERPAGRQARERLVGLLQLRIGQEWLKQLQPTTRPAAESLEEIIKNIRVSLFPPDEEKLDVYVLTEAIPIMVKPPTVKPPAPKLQDESATRPEESIAQPDGSAIRPEE